MNGDLLTTAAISSQPAGCCPSVQVLLVLDVSTARGLHRLRVCITVTAPHNACP